jgi:hypothetical protein
MLWASMADIYRMQYIEEEKFPVLPHAATALPQAVVKLAKYTWVRWLFTGC